MKSDLEISDLMTDDVIYFGDEDEKDLAEFCEIRDIDYLPLKESFEVMEYDGEGFSRKSLLPDMILAPDSKIFDKKVIESFENNSSVKFVSSGDKIVGVIHFSDYNSKDLYIELYGVIHELEQNLRRFLEHKELNEKVNLEEDLEISNFNPRDMALPLSTSNFSSLIKKIDNSDEIDIDFRQEKFTEKDYQIVELRNRVMHSKEMVLMQDSSKQELNFSEKSFKRSKERFEEAYRLKEYLSKKVRNLPEHPVLDNLRKN